VLVGGGDAAKRHPASPPVSRNASVTASIDWVDWRISTWVAALDTTA